MALTATAHRIGRAALRAEFDKIVPAAEPAEVSEAMIDRLFASPASTGEEHFALF